MCLLTVECVHWNVFVCSEDVVVNSGVCSLGCVCAFIGVVN